MERVRDYKNIWLDEGSLYLVSTGGVKVLLSPMRYSKEGDGIYRLKRSRDGMTVNVSMNVILEGMQAEDTV